MVANRDRPPPGEQRRGQSSETVVNELCSGGGSLVFGDYNGIYLMGGGQQASDLIERGGQGRIPFESRSS